MGDSRGQPVRPMPGPSCNFCIGVVFVTMDARKSPQVEISDYADVPRRAEELGLPVPTGLALLPRNFESAESRDELHHEALAPTVRTLWRAAGVDETPLDGPGERFPRRHEKAFDQVLPIIFVSTQLLQADPKYLKLAIEVLVDWLKHHLSGLPRRPQVRAGFVLRKTQAETFARVDYEGPVDGLKEIPDILRGIADS